MHSTTLTTNGLGNISQSGEKTHQATINDLILIAPTGKQLTSLMLTVFIHAHDNTEPLLSSATTLSSLGKGTWEFFLLPPHHLVHADENRGMTARLFLMALVARAITQSLRQILC